MNALGWIVAFGALSFLLGSIPFGVLVARAFSVRDLTHRGSGNIGATNVSRVLGFWPAGFLTFLLDTLKGALPAAALGVPWFHEQVFPGFPDAISGTLFSSSSAWVIGLLSVLGHCFSPWLRFKGGKGVATGFGVLLVLSPISALVGIVGFGLAFASTRIGSLASIAGLSVAVATHLVLRKLDADSALLAAIIFLILVRHEANIDALLQDRENAFR